MKLSTSLRRWTAPLAVSAGLLLVTACGRGDDMPQNTMDPKGKYAQDLWNLIRPVFWIAAVVFVLVQGLVLYAAIKFRAKSDDDRPIQIHGNSKFEIGWTIVPALILVTIGFATIGTIIEFDKEPEGDDVVQVEVIGKQWWWEYRYPDLGITTANELHIPTGRDINLTVTSADVIHNYWPPKLNGKIYAVPGRDARMSLQTDQPGVYFGECAEYCGLSHANMRLRVIAQPPDQFDQWARAQAANAVNPPAGSLAGDGATLFLNKGCGGCHAVNGVSSGRIGPNLTHFQSRQTFAGAIFENNPQNMRAWLRNPPEEKPGSIMPDLDLTEDEITKLIAYMETLR